MVFRKLFAPDSKGLNWGHFVGLVGAALATPEGQIALQNVLNHRWGWLIPVAVAYFGGAKAAETTE